MSEPMTGFMRTRVWLFGLAIMLQPAIALAQGRRGGRPSGAEEVMTGQKLDMSDSFANRPLVLMLALTALGLAPFVLLMVTSFV